MPTDADVHAAATVARCERGNLRHLLHSSQLEVLNQFEATSGRFVLEKGRRWGGTWFLLVLALSYCFRKPGARVVYGAPTLKFLKEFVLPTLDKICLLLPEGMRPKYNVGNSHIECWNGSYVHLFGCDDQRQADTGAGSDADLAIFDEAGATGVAALLVYIITSIFEPQLMANVDRPVAGRVLLSSSPPRIPEHEFTVMAEKAEAVGCYAHRSIYDNPRMSVGQIDELIRSKAADEGMTPEQYVKSDTWRREYLAQRVVDKTLVVLPEWADVRDTQFVAVPRPEFFDGMVVLDFGGVDPHFATLGYWHWDLAAYVVEREVMLRDGENTKQLTDALKRAELEAWGTDKWEGTLRLLEEAHLPGMAEIPAWLNEALRKAAPKQPRSRFCDNDIELARDLHQIYGYSIIPTAKNDLELQVQNARVFVGAKKLFIHPSCVHLDRHLRTTTWANANRTTFARRGGEHGDGAACLIYGIRNLDRQRNPYPPGWGLTADQRDRRPKQLNPAEVLARALRR